MGNPALSDSPSSSIKSLSSTPQIGSAKSFTHVTALEISEDDHSSQTSIDDAPVKVTRRARAIMTLVFCLGMMSNGLDFNVLGDASPYIAAEFHAFDKINWMSTATLLTSVSTLLLTSKLMNLMEVKYFFSLGLIIMAVGEALAGASTSYHMLLIGRICAGIAAPIVLVLGTTVTGMIWDSKKRPLMISIVIACYGVMIKVGPLVAGALIKRSISLWRWCFYLQLPILGLLISATLILFPKVGVLEDMPIKRVLSNLALPGLLQGAAFTCLVFPLVAGGTSHLYSWTGPSLITCYVLAVLFMAAFLFLEARNKEEDRYLPLEALREDRSVALMGVITFCSMFTIFGGTFYLPIMYQLVYKSSALRAAVQVLPNAVAGTVATILVGKVAERSGHFIPSCIIMSLFQVVGGALCSQFTPETKLWKLYLFTSISGIGAGGLASIGTPFVLEKTTLKRYGAGAAYSNLCLLLGAGIGVASVGVVLAHEIQACIPEIHALDPSIALGSNIWQNLITIYFGNAAVQSVFRAAFMKGMDIGGILYAGVGALSLIASLGLKWQKMHQHGIKSSSSV